MTGGGAPRPANPRGRLRIAAPPPSLPPPPARYRRTSCRHRRRRGRPPAPCSSCSWRPNRCPSGAPCCRCTVRQTRRTDATGIVPAARRFATGDAQLRVRYVRRARRSSPAAARCWQAGWPQGISGVGCRGLGCWLTCGKTARLQVGDTGQVLCVLGVGTTRRHLRGAGNPSPAARRRHRHPAAMMPDAWSLGSS